MQVPVIVQTVGLLTLSNVFMTIAWYGHLKNLSGKVWWIAALVSWGIALFEYLLQVPANRIGPTEDYSGSDYTHGIRSLCHAVYGATVQTRLRLGGTLFAWRRLFYFPIMNQFSHAFSQSFSL